MHARARQNIQKVFHKRGIEIKTKIGDSQEMEKDLATFLKK